MPPPSNLGQHGGRCGRAARIRMTGYAKSDAHERMPRSTRAHLEAAHASASRFESNCKFLVRNPRSWRHGRHATNFWGFVPGLIVATRTESVGSVNFQGCELRGWIQQHVEGEYGAVRVQAQATLRALASLVPRQAAPRLRPAQLHNTSARTHTLPRNAGLPQLSKMPFKHAGARACARVRLRVRT